jgi:tRNA pseudouridine32 synthase/23S rRNA pseudouridine746 synthase/23S rRNA pseudouridine1911/1915/1917 synthase
VTGTGKGSGRQQPRGLTLLYLDREVIVIAKPVGLLTIGTDGDKSRTVHAILNDYVRKGDPKSRQRVFVVHRLDRDTSGTLVFARNEAVKQYLQEHWEETEKNYLAVVHGSMAPREGIISSHLAENRAFRVYSTTDAEAGRLSHTEYSTLREARGFSLLAVRLLTGRKHQIRVHLAEKGHPIVGDRKYGREGDRHQWLALHAQSLTFTQPVTGKILSCSTPMPDHFTRLLGK